MQLEARMFTDTLIFYYYFLGIHDYKKNHIKDVIPKLMIRLHNNH